MRNCTWKRTIPGKIPVKVKRGVPDNFGSGINSITLSPNPAQAQAGSRASPSGDETLMQGRMGNRYAKSSGVSGTPTTKVIPQRDGRFLIAPLSPLKPFDRLRRFTSPLNIVSPPSAQLSSRFEPDNLTDREDN